MWAKPSACPWGEGVRRWRPLVTLPVERHGVAAPTEHWALWSRPLGNAKAPRVSVNNRAGLDGRDARPATPGGAGSRRAPWDAFSPTDRTRARGP